MRTKDEWTGRGRGLPLTSAGYDRGGFEVEYKIRNGSGHPPTVLDAESVSVIRRAAEELWRRRRRRRRRSIVQGGMGSTTSGTTSSRFTYQRAGNSEAHLSDLIEIDPTVLELMDDALLDRIYPLLRDAFSSSSSEGEGGEGDDDDGRGSCRRSPPLSSLDDDRHRLVVYDALVIRYDAEEATRRRGGISGRGESFDGDDADHAFTVVGAGQPLHRDLGLCSVNVALNDAEEYSGGGTFFENLIGDVDDGVDDGGYDRPGRTTSSAAAEAGYGSGGAVVRVPTAGHVVAHPCGERHAGVATTRGVRDVLVIFVTARDVSAGGCGAVVGDVDVDDEDDRSATTSSSSSAGGSITPRIERGARIRGEAGRTTKDDDVHLRRALYRAAIVENPHDGESWHFLGMGMLSEAHAYGDGDGRASTTTGPEEEDEEDGGGGDDVDDDDVVVPSVLHRTTIRLGELDAAVRCLERAGRLCPRDARVWNNLGLALSERRRYRRPLLRHRHRRSEGVGGDDDDDEEEDEEEEEARIELCFRRAVHLNDVASSCGVDVDVYDRDAALLNLGLLLADRDDFDGAATVLGRVVGRGDVIDGDDDGTEGSRVEEVAGPAEAAAARVVRDAVRLRRFCVDRLRG